MRGTMKAAVIRKFQEPLAIEETVLVEKLSLNANTRVKQG
jgi:hypothetical protein